MGWFLGGYLFLFENNLCYGYVSISSENIYTFFVLNFYVIYYYCYYWVKLFFLYYTEYKLGVFTYVLIKTMRDVLWKKLLKTAGAMPVIRNNSGAKF